MKGKVLIYWASLLPLHFWNSSRATSEKSIWGAWSNLSTTHFCAWEILWTDQTISGYKGWWFSTSWGDTLDLVWAVTFITSPSASLSSSALTIYVNICLGFLTSVLDRNSFNHKWLSTISTFHVLPWAWWCSDSVLERLGINTNKHLENLFISLLTL